MNSGAGLSMSHHHGIDHLHLLWQNQIQISCWRAWSNACDGKLWYVHRYADKELSSIMRYGLPKLRSGLKGMLDYRS